MCTLANRPSTPQNPAHGLQSPTELPCKVSNWCHCHWPASGQREIFSHWELSCPEIWRRRLYFECSNTAVGGCICSALLHIANPPLRCTVFVGAFWLHLEFVSSWWIQHGCSMLLKSVKEICFSQFGHFAQTWWASPCRRFVSITIWKCPLAVDKATLGKKSSCSRRRFSLGSNLDELLYFQFTLV